MITLFVLIGTLVFGRSCALNSLDYALVHSQNVHKVDITKEDITRTGQSLEYIIQIDGTFGSLQFNDHSLIPTNWEVIEFKLKLSAYEVVYKVKIFNKTVLNGQGSKVHKYEVTTANGVLDVLGRDTNIISDYDDQLHQVEIGLYDKFNIGFAVWDIAVNHNISISTKQVHLRDGIVWFDDNTDPSYRHQIYLVNSSTTGSRAYMNFTFDDPDSIKEYRFLLILNAKTPIDVYLSAFGAKQATKLARFEFASLMYTDFVLSQYVYARQLGKFELSFVFDGHVASEDSLMVYLRAARIDKKEAHPVKRLLVYLDSQAYDGNFGWWYNNPGLFGYTAVANSKTPLYACDIMANCYPYDRLQVVDRVVQVNETANETVHIWNFDLPEQYKGLLSHSPFIRLYSDDLYYTVYKNSSYLSANKVALARIESHLSGLALKPQYILLPINSYIFYRTQVPRQTRIPLSIPIDTIDPRAQSIDIKIFQIKSYREVHIVGVKVNGENKNINKNSIFSSSALPVSTADYIQVTPWTMTNEVKSFEIEFEVPDQSVIVNDSELVDLEIQISVKAINENERRYIENLLKRPIKFGDENCYKGPTYGELDCHYDEYKCPEYYFKHDPIAKTCTRTDGPMLH